MKPILNKWQFIYKSGLPIQYHTDLFTRRVTLGLFKLTSLPVEGIRPTNAAYKGFIFEWYYWWPLRRGKHL